MAFLQCQKFSRFTRESGTITCGRENLLQLPYHAMLYPEMGRWVGRAQEFTEAAVPGRNSTILRKTRLRPRDCTSFHLARGVQSDDEPTPATISSPETLSAWQPSKFVPSICSYESCLRDTSFRSWISLTLSPSSFLDFSSPAHLSRSTHSPSSPSWELKIIGKTIGKTRSRVCSREYEKRSDASN